VLIKFLLAIDPEKRSTALEALESQWIQKDIAWLRTKYRENVLGHWFKSCATLDRLAHQRKQQEQQEQQHQERACLHPAVEAVAGMKRSQMQRQEAEREDRRQEQQQKDAEGMFQYGFQLKCFLFYDE